MELKSRSFTPKEPHVACVPQVANPWSRELHRIATVNVLKEKQKGFQPKSYTRSISSINMSSDLKVLLQIYDKHIHKGRYLTGSHGYAYILQVIMGDGIFMDKDEVGVRQKKQCEKPGVGRVIRLKLLYGLGTMGVRNAGIQEQSL